MNWESLIPHVLTVIASGLTAWIAMEKRIAVNTEAIATLRKDVKEIEVEQDAWRGRSEQLAVVINDLTHYSERLKKIETNVEIIRERVR